MRKSVVSILYVSTYEKEADILTMLVDKIKLRSQVQKIGVGSIVNESGKN